jgi:hypothetical protein
MGSINNIEADPSAANALTGGSHVTDYQRQINDQNGDKAGGKKQI